MSQNQWVVRIKFDKVEDEMVDPVQEKLVVRYTTADGIAPELDKALIKLLKANGWHCWASGTDLETRERDLTFDRGPKVADLLDNAEVE